MQLVRGLHNLDDSHRGSVLTIGNFDGVHKGHQAILQRLQNCADDHLLPSTVMIFEPHPEELFNRGNPPARLTRLREKLVQFKKYHVGRVVLVKFNQQFSQMKAEDFVLKLLIEKLGVKHLIIGDDFHFGYKRQGNYQILQKLAIEYQFNLENTHTLTLAEQRISSTSVRQALADGDMKKTELLLGRVYSMSGRIFHGDKRGRLIGFPTANLLLHRNVLPLNGVFAVKMLINEGKLTQSVHEGIANIGNRPTVDGHREQLEVHLFDFNADIYGKAVTVNFLKFIRKELKFSGIEQLQKQISKDVESVKTFFANTK